MDLDAAREVFEASQDLTVGIEEEWALVDPDTLELVPRYEVLRAGADKDEVLREAAASGELISSEIEIRSGRGEDVHHALKLQREARRRLFALADSHGVALGQHRHAPAVGTTASSTSSTPSTTAASRRACST